MRFLNPIIDVAFKKIFGSQEHKQIIISFLNSILEYTGKRSITEVQFLNTEQKRMIDGKKDNILDILCIDQSENRYIVEVQVEGMKEFGKRIVYYASKTYALQLGAKQSYRALSPVVAISILDFSLFPDKKAYKSIHNILDIKTHEHDLQELSFAFVELSKFNKQEHELKSDEDKWLYFLKNIDTKKHIPEPLKEGVFKEACNAAERMKWTEEEFNAYEDAIVRATDVIGKRDFAFEEGERKGQKEGKKEGERESKIAIAQSLLKSGKLSIEDISLATGLTTNEIEELKKK